MKRNQKESWLRIPAALVLLILLAAGWWGIATFVRLERNEQIGHWQRVLGLIADSRAGQVQRWLEEEFTVLREVAQNGSVQLYMEQLAAMPDKAAGSEDEAAQLTYLKNLIIATGERTGFSDHRDRDRAVKANIFTRSASGLVLLDAQGRVMAATPGMTPVPVPAAAGVRQVIATGQAAVIDLFRNENDAPVVGFLQPIVALTPATGSPRTVGILLGLRSAVHRLYPMLKADSPALGGIEVVLLQKGPDDLIFFASPLNGESVLNRREHAANLDMAAAFAVANPGVFGEGLDHAGRKALFGSRHLTGTPWVLLTSIPRVEALGQTEKDLRVFTAILALILAFAVSLLVAAWWHGATARSHRMVAELEKKSKELQAQAELLQAISDQVRDDLFLLDEEGRFVFANRAFCERFSLSSEQIVTMPAMSVFGPGTMAELAAILDEREGDSLVRQQIVTVHLAGVPRVLAATALASTFPAEGGTGRGRLVVLHDLTALRESQQRELALLDQIVQALMRAIDFHDPYSANHSARTKTVALALGRELAVSDADLATITIAASLCNLGKLFLPADLLTRTTALTDEEKKTLEKEPGYVREILAGIPFSGPVTETIAQKQERLDGSGYPGGLRGEEILFTARVLAVANAYVAMVSPRAYRDRLEPRDVLDRLYQESGAKYDRKVVATLICLVENQHIDLESTEC